MNVGDVVVDLHDQPRPSGTTHFQIVRTELASEIASMLLSEAMGCKSTAMDKLAYVIGDAPDGNVQCVYHADVRTLGFFRIPPSRGKGE